MDANKTPYFDEMEYSALKLKLKDILSCGVCWELRRSAMYQCKFGHLICAGCFGDILCESRLQNGIASCPKCQSTISKELCSRNVAVEKTISELPTTCPHCQYQVPPELYNDHKKVYCSERPADCWNNVIGCPWEGSICEKFDHHKECKQLSANGYEILKSLLIMDKKYKEEVNLYEKIFDLLSVEKFSYYDLQFKRTNKGIEVVYETSKFSAFENLWLVHGYFKEESSQFIYQLVLKSKLTLRLNLHFLLVDGPYGEMEIKPKLCQYTFSDKCPESPFETLTLFFHSDALESFFKTKRVNFRIFIFINE